MLCGPCLQGPLGVADGFPLFPAKGIERFRGARGQSHAFHLACTTVLGLAAYQAVIAVARNSEGFDFWGGVLMTGANATLLFPMLAIPIIFGGLRSRRLRDLSPAELQV